MWQGYTFEGLGIWRIFLFNDHTVDQRAQVLLMQATVFKACDEIQSDKNEIIEQVAD